MKVILSFIEDIVKVILQKLTFGVGDLIVRRLDNHQIKMMFKKNNEPFYAIIENRSDILDIFVNSIERQKEKTCCTIDSHEFLEILNEPSNQDIIKQLQSAGYLETHEHLNPSGIYVISLTHRITRCIGDLKYSRKVKNLENIIDKLSRGEQLNGHSVQESIDLPLPIIEGYFNQYKNTKNGLVTDSVGESVFIKK